MISDLTLFHWSDFHFCLFSLTPFASHRSYPCAERLVSNWFRVWAVVIRGWVCKLFTALLKNALLPGWIDICDCVATPSWGPFEWDSRAKLGNPPTGKHDSVDVGKSSFHASSYVLSIRVGWSLIACIHLWVVIYGSVPASALYIWKSPLSLIHTWGSALILPGSPRAWPKMLKCWIHPPSFGFALAWVMALEVRFFGKCVYWFYALSA